MGFGVLDFGTTGKNSDIDFLMRLQEGGDSISYKRTVLDPKDLSSYDEQFDQVQPGEEMVEGSLSDKCTFGAMQDFLRMMNGANPGVTGTNPFTYAFTGANKAKPFFDPAHYQAGSTPRGWSIELFKGTTLRSTTETFSNYGDLTFVPGPPATITRSSGTFDTNVYKRGAIVTVANGVASDAVFNGVYVVESATTTTLTLRQTGDGWYTTDIVVNGVTGASSLATISAVYYESLFYHGCEIKGLKLEFKRNDYVQRTLDLMGKTFSLGASSHSYRQSKTLGNLELASGATGPGVTANTITRRTGDWIADGYVVGGTVKIHASDQSANVGVEATISALTTTVLTVSTNVFTVDADDDTLRVSGSAMANAARIFGGTPSTQLHLWVIDYATSNPGQSTKFLTLGGTTFICTEADLSIEEPIDYRYDIGQSSSEQMLPEKKRSVKITATIETPDDKFLSIVNRPDTKAFGASGGDYTGQNKLYIEGAGSTAGSSLTFLFPYLVFDGDAETRVENIGPTSCKVSLKAMSDDVNSPAYTCTVVNAESGYRT